MRSPNFSRDCNPVKHVSHGGREFDDLERLLYEAIDGECFKHGSFFWRGVSTGNQDLHVR